jgi:hypothetical protein
MIKAFLALIAAIALTSTAAAQAQLVTEEMMVKSPDPGIEIFVRNKRPAAMTAFRPERTVLFVHGATYPAHAAFDLRLGGRRAATTSISSTSAATASRRGRRKWPSRPRTTRRSCAAIAP